MVSFRHSSSVQALVVALLLTASSQLLPATNAFQVRQQSPRGNQLRSFHPRPINCQQRQNYITSFGVSLHVANNIDDDESVPLGSEEYYGGFLSRSLGEEPEERVTGDALLGPTFKFVGGFAVALGALLVAFLVSNGLL